MSLVYMYLYKKANKSGKCKDIFNICIPSLAVSVTEYLELGNSQTKDIYFQPLVETLPWWEMMIKQTHGEVGSQRTQVPVILCNTSIS